MAIYKSINQVKSDEELLNHVREYLINMNLDPAALVLQEFDAMVVYLFEKYRSWSAMKRVNDALQKILDNTDDPLRAPKGPDTGTGFVCGICGKAKCDGHKTVIKKGPPPAAAVKLTPRQWAALEIFNSMMERAAPPIHKDTVRAAWRKSFEYVDIMFEVSDALEKE